MSVSLGEFRELETDMAEDELIMVVDTTENVIDEVPVRGLLLHHPKMNDASNGTTAKVTAKSLAELNSIRATAIKSVAKNPVLATG